MNKIIHRENKFSNGDKNRNQMQLHAAKCFVNKLKIEMKNLSLYLENKFLNVK